MKYLSIVLVLVCSRVMFAQTVSYITPDAAAPGMTVVIDVIGPNTPGNFGTDGLYQPGEKVVLVNPADSADVVLGHAIVSWDGKLVQVMMLVRANATSRSIRLAVRNGAATSSPFTFEIIRPGAVGRRSGGGVLGSAIGTRSARGTMVVDSLILDGGTYTISTIDPDLGTPGNQAYLPARILSLGPIRLLNNATISVRGANGNAGSYGGPGGGGGGGGAARTGGDGFTGGGGVGPAPRKGGTGTGSVTGSKNHHGGQSLNGVPGGVGTELESSAERNDEGGGGGTGHPFGSSGDAGMYGAQSLAGGHGAGSGGGQGTAGPAFSTYGGGGAGYSSRGTAGAGLGDNAGNVHGNVMIVPFAGGSGGASGNILYVNAEAGHGGGGGGAVELTSFSTVGLTAATIDASGGNGSDGNSGLFGLQNASGGGGGSGGAIVLQARDSITMGSTTNSPSLRVAGGTGGSGYNTGGNGGAGRIRLDGRLSTLTGNNSTSSYFDVGRDYIGLSIASVRGSTTSVDVRGFGKGFRLSGDNDRLIRLYYRYASTAWRSVDVRTVRDDRSFSASWAALGLPRTTEPTDTLIYLVAMQENPGAPGPNAFGREPAWVLSHVGGMIAKIPGLPRIAVQPDTIDFGRLRVGLCKDSSILIRSIGTDTLRVDTAIIEGDAAHWVLRTRDSLRIAVAQSSNIRLSFCPQDTGCFEARVRIPSNDVDKVVIVRGCGIKPILRTLAEVDFGSVRVGTCKDTTILFENVGNDTLRITRQTIPDPNYTIVAPPSPFDIPPYASVPVTLRYCAPDVTARVSYDTIVNTGETSPDIVRLLATGKQGELASIDTLDFGEVSAGGCKDSVAVLRNIGNDTLTISEPPSFSSEFTVLSGQLPITMAPGQTATLRIRFCPPAEASYVSEDSLTPLRPATGTLLVVRGEGVKGLFGIPGAIDIPCMVLGETRLDTIVLPNRGGAAITNIAAQLTGIPGGGIKLSPATSLAPSDSTIVVIEILGMLVGQWNGMLTVTASDVAPLQIPVTVRITERPTLLVDTTRLIFDTMEIGGRDTLCVTILNPSCRPVTVSALNIPDGVFRLLDAQVPFTLADSASRTICVEATVPEIARYVDTLAIVADTIVRNVELVVQGVGAIFALDPDLIIFPNTDIGTTSGPQPIRIINIGNRTGSIPAIVRAGPDPNDFSVSAPLLTDLPAGDTATIMAQFAPATAGSKRATVRLATASSDVVTLLGQGIDSAEATIKIDTVFARPGDVVRIPVRLLTDLSDAGVKELHVRVQFDPMRVDLRRVVNEGADIAPTTVTHTSHSLGDHTIHVTSEQVLDGTGTIAFMEAEVLLGVNNSVPLVIGSVDFGDAPVRVQEALNGLLSIQECDTTENVVFAPTLRSIVLSPNPAQEYIRAELIAYADATVTYEIMDITGKIQIDQTIDVTNGNRYSTILNVAGLPSGSYTVRVSMGGSGEPGSGRTLGLMITR